MNLERRGNCEFSRFLPLSALDGEPLRLSIEAEAGERQALAQRFGLLDLSALSADLWVQRRGDLIEVNGLLRASVDQSCVVTLAPLHTRVEQEFHQLYTSEPLESGSDEVVLEADRELPEPIVGEGVDLGEAVAQQLAVCLDSYPRGSDIRFDESVELDVGGSEGQNDGPFAVLAALKRTQ